jgi:hypothetical protein
MNGDDDDKVHQLAADPFTTASPDIGTWPPPPPATKKSHYRAYQRKRLVLVLKRKFGPSRPVLSNPKILEELLKDPEVQQWPPDAKPSQRTTDRAIDEAWCVRL